MNQTTQLQLWPTLNYNISYHELQEKHNCEILKIEQYSWETQLNQRLQELKNNPHKYTNIDTWTTTLN